MNQFKVKVDISIDTIDDYYNSDNVSNVRKSSGSRYFEHYGEELDVDKLVEAIIDALPKQELPPFDFIQIFKDGKAIAHGENN